MQSRELFRRKCFPRHRGGDDYTLPQLVATALQYRIPHAKATRKMDLFAILLDALDRPARTLQRATRAWLRMRPTNDRDPVGLSDFEYPHVFRVVQPNGAVHMFNVGTLVAYFQSSGTLEDPISRQRLTATELARLDRAHRQWERCVKPAAERAHTSASPCADALANAARYAEMQEVSDMHVALEREYGEYIGKIHSIISDAEVHMPHYFLSQVISTVLHKAQEPFKDLLAMDRGHAEHALETSLHFLAGPEPRPTRDMLILLPDCLSELCAYAAAYELQVHPQPHEVATMQHVVTMHGPDAPPPQGALPVVPTFVEAEAQLEGLDLQLPEQHGPYTDLLTPPCSPTSAVAPSVPLAGILHATILHAFLGARWGDGEER